MLTLLNNLFHFKVVLENLSRGEDYECPFARASIALCKMLCEVLTINSEPRKLSYLTANSINSSGHIHDDVILTIFVWVLKCFTAFPLFVCDYSFQLNCTGNSLL